jgi:hypothetical protein
MTSGNKFPKPLNPDAFPPPKTCIKIQAAVIIKK